MNNEESSKYIKDISIRRAQTVSKAILKDIRMFSLADQTDISEEAYEEIRGYILLEGSIRAKDLILNEGDFIYFDPLNYFGIEALRDSKFIEIIFKKGEREMINLEVGRALNLKNLIEYEDEAIVNLDLTRDTQSKMMLMAFDAGQGLSPHRAPADAILIALDGEAEILVGEENFKIKEGEVVKFPKDELHNVTAITKFKMFLAIPR